MRTRYIVDNPRGPRGGNNDVHATFTSESSARRNVKRGEGSARGRVLVVDLDDLCDFDASPHEELEHAERMMCKWAQRCEETRTAMPGFGPSPLVPDAKLGREDLRGLSAAFVAWIAWVTAQRQGARSGVPYAPEADLHDAIVTLFEQLGEAPR